MFAIKKLIAELGWSRLLPGRRAARKAALIQPRASEQ
jgi:hypothetical protein